MLYYKNGINKIYTPDLQTKLPGTFISVIVCFRNEEEYLPQLLKSLLSQNYPHTHFEILMYNDSSNDSSLSTINDIAAQHKSHQIFCRNVPVLEGCMAAKKLAINHAAVNSKADLIVTTDADCSLDQNWLRLIEQCYTEKKAFLIAAPVAILTENDWLSELQSIEMQSLAAVTAGAIGNKKGIMCNGANLGFDRKMFLKLDPYKNNMHLSSGDDMFLMMAMQHQNSNEMFYVAHKNAIAYTKAKHNIGAYIQQRVRWASKSKNYDASRVKVVALIVLNMNTILLFSPLIILCNKLSGFILFGILIASKQIADSIILNQYSKVLKMEMKLFKLLLFQYIEAILTFTIALKSIKGSYQWKGRKQHF
jgi:cellulose synthase/poly-beta-1,6-N-acetylglucosamine synthase-like glycosyltransferase